MEPTREPDDGLLAKAFLDAPVPLWLVDLDGDLIIVNEATAVLFQRPREEFPGLPASAFAARDDREWTKEYMRRLAIGELNEFTALRMATSADGSRESLRLRVRPMLTDGAPAALVGSIFPAELRRQVTDARLSKLIANVESIIALVDTHGAVIESSGAHRAVLGYPPEFWEERTVFDLLRAEDIERVVALREAVLAEPGRPAHGVYPLRAADGTFHPFEVHVINLLDDPDVRGIVVTSRDISEHERLIRELGESRDEAIASAELRSRMVATVSHELRNPLHALAGLAELLVTSGDLSTDTAVLADTLLRQIEGLQTVVDDLLDESRLSMGTLALRSQAVAVRPFIDDVVAMARLGVQDKSLVVAAEVGGDVPPAVMADASRLRQVIGNLMGNAVKFTDIGGVTLRVAAADGRLRFEITDTGRGIAAHEVQAIFEPFTTAANVGSGSGAGLGLAIVRQLVTLMHGSVVASSSIGLGSTFTVTLPLVAAPTPQQGGAESLTPARGARVLVVEDNEVNQMLAKSQLTRLGMQAVIVGSGEAALELMAEGDGPALVLMDHQLPGIDGLETTRRLRAMEEGTGRRAIVISMTASATNADRAACEAAGMDDFMAKPVGLSVMNDMLTRWLRPERRSRPRAAVEVPVGVVERSALATLVEELGDTAVVVSLVQTFLDELQGRRRVLIDAADDHDLTVARRAAHTLKSSSLLLGATALGAACARMPDIDDLGDMRALVDEIVALSAVAARDFQGWLAEHR